MKKELKKNFIFFLCFLLLLPGTLLAQHVQKKVKPPKKITYGDKILTLNPAWQNKEVYLEANLDNDPNTEIIIGFVATYEPRSQVDLDEERITYVPPTKKEIPIIQNYAFYQIYDKGPDGYFKLVKTIPGMDQLGKVEIVKLDEKNPNTIAIFSPGGEHYLDLSLYQWKEGGYRLIFDQSSPQGMIELDSQKSPLTIRICKSAKKDGKETSYETFIWDSSTNVFKRIE